MKSNKTISLIDLLNKRGWNPDLIPIYLGNKVNFDLVAVIATETRLNKMGIKFKRETTQ